MGVWIIMSKNDINNFFVGELYLAYPINENAKQFLKDLTVKNNRGQ